jgi:hypothetical protein
MKWAEVGPGWDERFERNIFGGMASFDAYREVVGAEAYRAASEVVTSSDSLEVSDVIDDGTDE